MYFFLLRDLDGRFLCFVTANSVLPRQPIKIQYVAGSGYPVSHTCFSRLDLPEYGDVAKVRCNEDILSRISIFVRID